MPSNASPVRILVAGLGAFGREHLGRLAARPDVTVVGVADTNPSTLQVIHSHHSNMKCCTDPLRLIDETVADAIVIATPAASHVEICRYALNRNLCVLLEKPVAPSAAAIAPVLAAAMLSKGFVLPGHVLRFSKDHARLVQIVRSGWIGKVVYVNSRRYRDDSHAIRYADTDPVLMTLIHDIDLALWVTGSDFRAVVARRSIGSGFRSMTAVSATTVAGVTCDLRTAWTFTDGILPPDRLEVVGDRGSVELVTGQGLSAFAKGKCTSYLAAATDDPLQNEHAHFLACVLNRSQRRALELTDALAGLRLADAAIESLRLNREVVLSP